MESNNITCSYCMESKKDNEIYEIFESLKLDDYIIVCIDCNNEYLENN